MRAPAAVLALTLMLPGLSAAEENPGVSAAPILQLSPSVRASGMGSAFTAVSNDLSALYYNPAGLSHLDHRQVGLDYVKGFQDQNVEHFAAATPLPFAGFLGNGYATLGAGLTMAQNGKIEVNRTNADGSFRDTRSLNAGGDLVASFAYSERALESTFEGKGKSWSLRHLVGIGGKFVRSTLAEQYSATALGGDIGYLLSSPELGLSFGAAAQNFGTKMRFIEEGDPLPLTFRGGFAYLQPLDLLESPPSQSVLFSLDGDYLYYERTPHANIGIEYSAMRMYSLRLGYQIHREVAGLTFGFGVLWRGVSVDYAWALNDALGDIHRFGIAWRFGRVSTRTRERPQRPFIESMPEDEDLEQIEKKTPEFLDEPARPKRTPAGGNSGAPGWIY
jgi:hypothetical protein